MEKVILENGQEFELVADGVNSKSGSVIFTILPGDMTVEQIAELFTGNEKVTVKDDGMFLQSFDNMIKCSSVKMQYDHFINMVPACPECWKVLDDPTLTQCPYCEATFEHPDMVQNRGKVCFVEIALPDINDRVANVETAVQDISVTLLSLTSELSADPAAETETQA